MWDRVETPSPEQTHGGSCLETTGYKTTISIDSPDAFINLFGLKDENVDVLKHELGGRAVHPWEPDHH